MRNGFRFAAAAPMPDAVEAVGWRQLELSAAAMRFELMHDDANDAGRQL